MAVTINNLQIQCHFSLFLFSLSSYQITARRLFSLLPANSCFGLYYVQHYFYFLGVQRKFTLLVFVSYYNININNHIIMIIYMYMYFCFQVLSRFLEEFRVPASASTITMLDGKLFQFFITVSVTTYTRLVTVLVCAIQIIKALCVLYAFLSESE